MIYEQPEYSSDRVVTSFSMVWVEVSSLRSLPLVNFKVWSIAGAFDNGEERITGLFLNSSDHGIIFPFFWIVLMFRCISSSVLIDIDTPQTNFVHLYQHLSMDMVF